MTKTSDRYEKLLGKQRRVAMLGSVGAVLSWDKETYMPPAGAKHRSEQAAFLAGLKHEWATDPEIGDLLSELEESTGDWDPRSVEAVNVREWRRDYDRATKLPRELVEEISRTQVLSREAWGKARKSKDFPLFRPWLEKMVALQRRVAECYGYEREPYDALLDTYEPGMTASEIAPILESLRDRLVPLLNAIQGASRRPDLSIVRREFPIPAQEAFAKEVAAAIGYDFEGGRLDVVTHPFCNRIGPGDVRITTRYDERFFNSAFFSVVHEAGHGIHAQNLPEEHWGTPMAESPSHGVSESQSRSWENFVARSRPFWEFWYPKAQERFAALADVSLDDFVFAVNNVEPSFIRVEADEATYNLHILVRFRIERALIGGDLEAADAPGAWNEQFKECVGLDVPDDAMGCLQDVHWSSGLMGYFPSYTLGNLYAAQFFEKAREDLGDVDDLMHRGEFVPLREWMTDNIHSQGRRYRPAELIQVVTGRPLDASALVRCLESKFGELYGVTVQDRPSR
ncbi:MAG TPA: carboxypeptidase M32 [Sumerlaeia bacterium]|nr:carboxypeptidase M32 [Sumerlaeia bacterium]